MSAYIRHNMTLQRTLMLAPLVFLQAMVIVTLAVKNNSSAGDLNTLYGFGVLCLNSTGCIPLPEMDR